MSEVSKNLNQTSGACVNAPRSSQNAVHRPTSLEMFSIVILSSTRLREKASFFLHEPVGWFLRAPCEKNSLEYFHDSKVAPDLPQRVCDLPQPGVAAKLHPSDNKCVTGDTATEIQNPSVNVLYVSCNP